MRWLGTHTIAIDNLKPHPENTHGKITPKDVAELTENIKAVGLLDPLIVKGTTVEPSGEKYQILAGHRRAIAARAAGLDRVACQVVDCDEGQAKAILLLSNRDRTQADPFREADAVAALAGDARTNKEIGALLGHGHKWVAQRIALSMLDPKIRSAARDGKKIGNHSMGLWSVADFELLSKVAQADQIPFLERHPWLNETDQVADAVAESLHRLGLASWDLDDATLVPKAGACSACPKTSAACPGLFDDDETGTAQNGSLKKATCLDGGCWASKARAGRLDAITAAKKKHDGLLLVRGDHMSGNDEIAMVGEDLAKTLVGEYEHPRCKPNAPGAKPAIVIGGKDDGKVVWVAKPKRTHESNGLPAKPKRTAKEVRHTRIVKHALELARKDVLDAEPPSPARVLALVAAFGLDPHHTEGLEQDAFAAVRQGKSSFGVEEFCGLAWDRVKHRIASALMPGNTADNTEAAWKAACWVLKDGLGRDYVQLLSDAETEIFPSKTGKKPAPQANTIPTEKLCETLHPGIPPKAKAPKARKVKSGAPA